jgi:hypothetical protein
MIWLFAFLLGGRVGWIKDHQGEVYKTTIYTDAWGGRWCRVFWFKAIGHCVLLDNGTVDPKSDSSYVREWKYALGHKSRPNTTGE